MSSRPLPPLGPGNLFTLADALSAGWTTESLRYAVNSGRCIRVRPGVFTPASEEMRWPETLAAARRRMVRAAIAAAGRCEPAVVSHSAAAAIHQVPLLPSERACLTSPPGSGTKELPGVHIHRAGLPPDHVDTVDGLRMTSMARTALDIAREHGVEAGLVVADAALRQGETTQPQLHEVREFMERWPGRRAARAVAQLARAEAESPLETLSRLRLLAAGFPAPRLQQVILDEHGTFVARTDFYWDEYGVVGEADGNAKYDDRNEIVRERRREQALTGLGLVVVRWEWRDVRRFDGVTGRLAAAFDRGLRPGHPARRWQLP
jgi:very-short-patch-repair endonuclease